jgi:glutamate carboxypeptidase
MTCSGGEILGFLQGQRSALVDLIERLIRAESPSTDPASHRAVRDVLRSEFENLGFMTRAVPGAGVGGQLYARPRARRRHAPRQLVIGHFDTVWPVGTLEAMPFSFDGQRVRGPGVFDMKGGLAQLVFALRAIAGLQIETAVVPIVFLNSDEEIGSRESTRYIRALARRAGRALVLEPALGPEGAIKTSRKGVGRYTITVKGRAAHAGLDPERGVSAILELSYIIQQLFALNDPAQGVTVNVGTIDGGLRPNVVAPESRAVVDVRVRSPEDAVRIDAAIKALRPRAEGIALVVEGGIGRPPLERTARNRALWEQARRLGEELAIHLTEGQAGGGSDGNTTSQYTATLDGLGPVGDGAHAHHEQLDIDRTLERTALLTLLLASPLAGT